MKTKHVLVGLAVIGLAWWLLKGKKGAVAKADTPDEKADAILAAKGADVKSNMCGACH